MNNNKIKTHACTDIIYRCRVAYNIICADSKKIKIKKFKVERVRDLPKVFVVWDFFFVRFFNVYYLCSRVKNSIKKIKYILFYTRISHNCITLGILANA